MKYSRFIVQDDFARYGIRVGQPKSLSYLQVEITDRCNLRCASCPRAAAPSSRDILSLDDFDRMLDENPSVEQVSFVGGGEALLVENFSEYVQSCSRRAIFSSCNTNGILVETRLAPVVEAGLGKVAISVDAGDESLLFELRSGLKLETLRRSIASALRLTSGTPTQVSCAVTLSTMNVHSFASTVRFLIECDVREITVESLHHWGTDKSLNRHSLFHAEDRNRVVSSLEEGLEIAEQHDLEVQIFDYRRLLQPPMGSTIHCPWPWDAAMITCKGDVTPCCVNLEASPDNRMGNIHEASLDEIWRGPIYTNLRESFTAGREWSMCVDCVYRMEFGRVEGEQDES